MSEQIPGQLDPNDLSSAMTWANELAATNARDGGGPFAALIFDDSGRVVATGVNKVVPENDPTAHAEVVAIRSATSALQTYNLASKGKFTLVSSSEPCGMCATALIWAGVSKLVFGATFEDVQTLTGFDEGIRPKNCDKLWEERGIEVVREVLRAKCCEVLKDYQGEMYNGGLVQDDVSR